MSKKTIRVSDATFRAIAHGHGFVCDDEVGEPSWLTDKFEEELPDASDWSTEEEEEIAISDEDVAQVWGDIQVVFPVLMEDAPLHDVSAPFCGDPTCMCHNDAAHYEYIEQPILAGLLTPWEGSRLYWGEAI